MKPKAKPKTVEDILANLPVDRAEPFHKLHEGERCSPRNLHDVP